MMSASHRVTLSTLSNLIPGSSTPPVALSLARLAGSLAGHAEVQTSGPRDYLHDIVISISCLHDNV